MCITFLCGVKIQVAEGVIEILKPIQVHYEEMMKNKDLLEKYMKEGAEKAEYVANKTLKKVQKKSDWCCANKCIYIKQKL